MPTFEAYIAGRLPVTRAGLGAHKHPDVSLLAHMAILVCAQSYGRSGQLQSRASCFRIALGYVTDYIWPLTDVVPSDLGNRSVFLGQGRFEEGSVRKWVADLHGLVLAQRLSAVAAVRRGKRADSWADMIREDSEVHLQHLIDAVAKYAMSDPALLIAALQQLQKELL